jgi:hypothetical protein
MTTIGDWLDATPNIMPSVYGQDYNVAQETASASAGRSLGGIGGYASVVKGRSRCSEGHMASVRARAEQAIIGNVERLINAMGDERLAIVARDVVTRLVDAMLNSRRPLPPLHGVVDDDGSLLIELAADSKRLGLTFDAKRRTGHWYFASVTEADATCVGGPVSSADFDTLVSTI